MTPILLIVGWLLGGAILGLVARATARHVNAKRTENVLEAEASARVPVVRLDNPDSRFGVFDPWNPGGLFPESAGLVRGELGGPVLGRRFTAVNGSAAAGERPSQAGS